MNAQHRYIELLKNSLLNEPYLENEVRLLYIFGMMASGRPVDTDVVRDINRRLPDWVETVRLARQEGRIWWNLNVNDATGNPKTHNNMPPRRHSA